MFRINVGTLDRVIRIVLGSAMLAFGLVGGRSAWWGWLGILPLVTGLAAHCPFYDAVGWTTYRGKDTREEQPS